MKYKNENKEKEFFIFFCILFCLIIIINPKKKGEVLAPILFVFNSFRLFVARAHTLTWTRVWLCTQKAKTAHETKKHGAFIIYIYCYKILFL